MSCIYSIHGRYVVQGDMSCQVRLFFLSRRYLFTFLLIPLSRCSPLSCLQVMPSLIRSNQNRIPRKAQRHVRRASNGSLPAWDLFFQKLTPGVCGLTVNDTPAPRADKLHKKLTMAATPKLAGKWLDPISHTLPVISRECSVYKLPADLRIINKPAW